MQNAECRRSNARAGFSLLELLVSIGIFVVITTAVTLNFRSGERISQLRVGAETVASAIRTLQTMAQSGRLTSLCTNSPYQVCLDDEAICGEAGACRSNLPRGGYGIAIQSGEFIVFADGNRSFTLDTGEELSTISVALPQEVQIDPDRTDLQTLVFEPPNGHVWINGVDTLSEGRIRLNHNQLPDVARQIVIHAASGRVEVIE